MPSGSDIPAELLRRILYFVTIDSRGNPRFAAWTSSQLRKEDKQDISACALACSDWAKQCRCLLYQEITLRSAQDIRTLTSFASKPPSSRFTPVSHYIGRINVKCAVIATEPWLHHLYPLLKLIHHPYDPKQRRYVYERSLPPAAAETAWTWNFRGSGWLSLDVALIASPEETIRLWEGSSIHNGLPKKLPIAYHAFESLTIEGVRFRSLDDILRAVRSLEPLGSGFSIVLVGSKKYIRSIPKELNTDQSTVLEVIQMLGFVSVSMLKLNLNWEKARAQTVIDDLLADGLVWLDAQGAENEYWSPQNLLDDSG